MEQITDERYLELKKSGKYKKQSSLLLHLNELYHKYLYICQIDSIEAEKKRLNQIFNER